MNKPNLSPVTLSKGDHKRLQTIARSFAAQSHPLAAALLQELGRAELREPDDIPEGTVALSGYERICARFAPCLAPTAER